MTTTSLLLRLLAALALPLLLLLPGCTVVTVGAAAVSVTTAVVGTAASVAVGTAKVVGKGVGAAYDAMTDEAADPTLSSAEAATAPAH